MSTHTRKIASSANTRPKPSTESHPTHCKSTGLASRKNLAGYYRQPTSAWYARPSVTPAQHRRMGHNLCKAACLPCSGLQNRQIPLQIQESKHIHAWATAQQTSLNLATQRSWSWHKRFQWLTRAYAGVRRFRQGVDGSHSSSSSYARKRSQPELLLTSGRRAGWPSKKLDRPASMYWA